MTATMRSASRVLVALALALATSPLAAQRHARSHPAPPPADRVIVAAGEFIMGNDDHGEQDERPAHRANLPAFWIDRLEVTRAQYDLCEMAGACTTTRALPERFHVPQYPVVGVSWHQATAYCAWVGARLPTESEWEKAARGTDGRTYPWGESYPTNDRAVFGRPTETGYPDRVGTHPRGVAPCGALDMAGNVWEWTASPYDPYAYRHLDTAPTCETALAALTDLRDRHVRGFTGSNPLPTTCERVLRGGGWNYGGEGLRMSNRVHHGPQFQLAMSGFRCASDSAPSASP